MEEDSNIGFAAQLKNFLNTDIEGGKDFLLSTAAEIAQNVDFYERMKQKAAIWEQLDAKPDKALLNLARAIKDKTAATSLSQDEREYIYGLIWLTGQKQDNASAIERILYNKIGVTLQEFVDAFINDNQDYLPLLEPTTAEKVNSAFSVIFKKTVISRPESTLFPVSKLSRIAPLIRNSENKPFTVKLTDNEQLNVKWNVMPQKDRALRIEPFDMVVQRAISNIVARHGKVTITLVQLWTEITGEEQKQITAKVERDLVESIERLKTTKIAIVISKTKNKKEEKKIAIQEAEILIAYPTQAPTKKGFLKGYEFPSVSKIYEYEQKTRQLISIRNDLNVIIRKSGGKKHTQYTKLAIVIREYLIMEYVRIKNTSNNRIRYDSIYGYESNPILVELNPDGSVALKDGKPILKKGETREEKQAIIDAKAHRRKIVKEILDTWKERKFIHNYKQYREGREYIGVKITIDKPEPVIDAIAKTATATVEKK